MIDKCKPMAKTDTFMAAIAVRPAPVAEPPRATLCSRFADKGSMRDVDSPSNPEGKPWWHGLSLAFGSLEFGGLVSGANADAAAAAAVAKQ